MHHEDIFCWTSISSLRNPQIRSISRFRARQKVLPKSRTTNVERHFIADPFRSLLLLKVNSPTPWFADGLFAIADILREFSYMSLTFTEPERDNVLLIETLRMVSYCWTGSTDAHPWPLQNRYLW
jgi:hypothetical protein